MTTYFEAIYDRIRHITNASTQVDLARVLGIRQSSISDAKRRGSIPADWYLTLFDKFGLNPDWLKKGLGPIYLRTEQGYMPSDDSLASQLSEDGPLYGDTIVHSLPVPVYSCEVAYTDNPPPPLRAEGMMSLPQHFVRPEVRVFAVKSAAMEPTIMRSAIIGVDCTSTRPISGEVFALYAPHEGIIIRRLYVDSDNDRVLLRADIPGHPESSLAAEALASRLLGRIAWVLQEF